jgi:hypothetical protein
MNSLIKAVFSITLIAMVASTFSFADKLDMFSYKPILDREEAFLKYEDPGKGEANARLWIEKGVIVLEFLTPAWNLHGIETAPNLRSELEKEHVNLVVNNFITNRQKYFTFRPADFCSLTSMSYRLEQDQGEEGAKKAEPVTKRWRHFDVRSEMLFNCKDASPEKMIVQVFSAFPRIKKINLQLLAHKSDLRRIVLTPEKTAIAITRSSSVKKQ